MAAEGKDLLVQIQEWQAEVDTLVGEEFTPERVARVEELDRLIDRARERLAPDGDQPDVR